MDKVKFIEEKKIKKELTEKLKGVDGANFKHSNPIRANLMKFVHFKQDNFKKDFE